MEPQTKVFAQSEPRSSHECVRIYYPRRPGNIPHQCVGLLLEVHEADEFHTDLDKVIVFTRIESLIDKRFQVLEVDFFSALLVRKIAKLHVELFHQVINVFLEILSARVQDFHRDPVACFRDGSCNGTEGIGISADVHHVPDSVFITLSLQVADDGFRYGMHAVLYVVIFWRDFFQGSFEVISELCFDIVADFSNRRYVARHEDGSRNGLCAFDAFRMVMCDLCCPASDLSGFLHSVVIPADRGYSHGGAVSIASVRFCVIPEDPTDEPSAVSGIGVASAPLLHGLDECLLKCLLILMSCLKESFCDRAGHDSVIRELVSSCKEFEFLALGASVKFKLAADDISDNCSKHN